MIYEELLAAAKLADPDVSVELGYELIYLVPAQVTRERYQLYKSIFEMYDIAPVYPDNERYGFMVWARVPADMAGELFDKPGHVSRRHMNISGRSKLSSRLKDARINIEKLQEYDNILLAKDERKWRGTWDAVPSLAKRLAALENDPFVKAWR
jgi:hypothetical protein